MKEGIAKESRKAGTDFEFRIPNPNYFLDSCVPQKSLNNQPLVSIKEYGS
jgi:hypothetical protein